MLLAATSVPESFQRTLMDRTDIDQGLITGIGALLNYSIGTSVQSAIDSAAMPLVGGGRDRAEGDDMRARRMAIALDLGAIATGLAIQSALKQEPGESLERASGRTAGYWLTAGAGAGLSAALLEEIIEQVGTTPRRKRFLDVVLPSSALVAGGVALRSRLDQWHASTATGDEHAAAVAAAKFSVGKSMGMSAGVSFVLAGLTAIERRFAGLVAGSISKILPGSKRFWRPAGHAATLAVLGKGIHIAVEQAYAKIEDKAELIEPAFSEQPTTSLVSGSPESAVKWETLSKQGRRNVSTYLRAQWIEAVMGTKAICEPIRVFVGEDSAPSEVERVNLAVEELERTGAFDRSLLMVISPTGTGYTNYVAVESAEYMTLGDMASVTLQYAKRPSFLSLDREGEGRIQYRMLLEKIHAKLRQRPKTMRPRLVLFGESLGAWTSEDAFRDRGTKGLLDLGVDRALWIGSPFGSRWRTQVLGEDRPDTDPSLVGEFNDFGEVMAMPDGAWEKLRYVMISHDNDAVVHFSPSLIVQAPDWLQDAAKRPATVPKTERWISPTTFLQTLVDMKNAANVVPGQFEAKGHDYRADLPQFVRFTYDLTASDTQMERINVALRRFELERAQLAKEEKPGGFAELVNTVQAEQEPFDASANGDATPKASKPKSSTAKRSTSKTSSAKRSSAKSTATSTAKSAAKTSARSSAAKSSAKKSSATKRASAKRASAKETTAKRSTTRKKPATGEGSDAAPDAPSE